MRYFTQRLRHILWAHTMQDRQARPFGNKPLNLGGLGPCGDEEIMASGLCQSLDDIHRAKAIAIGLYRSTATGMALRTQPLPILDKGIPIKVQAQRSRHDGRVSRAELTSRVSACRMFPAARSTSR